MISPGTPKLSSVQIHAGGDWTLHGFSVEDRRPICYDIIDISWQRYFFNNNNKEKGRKLRMRTERQGTKKT